MTTLYLMRHSKSMKGDNTCDSDSLQVQNEKYILSVEGEKLAEEKSKYFDNIDSLYSSSYVRAICTAKYIAERNNIEIKINSDLGERKFGVKTWEERPNDFERRQFLDENYKLGDGECQKEVRDRMYNCIMKIVNDNKDKTIVVVSHATAISFLLKKWCDIKIVDDKLQYSYKDRVIHYGHFDNCELFKLEFDDNNNLINIDNIKEQ